MTLPRPDANPGTRRALGPPIRPPMVRRSTTSRPQRVLVVVLVLVFVVPLVRLGLDVPVPAAGTVLVFVVVLVVVPGIHRGESAPEIHGRIRGRAPRSILAVERRMHRHDVTPIAPAGSTAPRRVKHGRAGAAPRVHNAFTAAAHGRNSKNKAT